MQVKRAKQIMDHAKHALQWQSNRPTNSLHDPCSFFLALFGLKWFSDSELAVSPSLSWFFPHFFRFLPLFKKKTDSDGSVLLLVLPLYSALFTLMTKERNRKSKWKWNKTILLFTYHDRLLLLIIEKILCKSVTMWGGRCWTVVRFWLSNDKTGTISLKMCHHFV